MFPISCKVELARFWKRGIKSPPFENAATTVPPCSLPDEVNHAIGEYALSNLNDLPVVASVSLWFYALVLSVARDCNAPVWENEFKTLDPVLHACISPDDYRETWRERVFRVAEIQRQALHEEPLQTESAVSEVVLYKIPSKGFLVNIGELHGAMVLYGLREEKGILSSAEEFLMPFGLPIFKSLNDSKMAEAGDYALVLASIDGSRISEFSCFEEAVESIKNAPTLCRFRFVFMRVSDMPTRIPETCRTIGVNPGSAAQALRRGLEIGDDDDLDDLDED